MSETIVINLADISWPANILTCNMRLSAMEPGNRLELVMDDPALKDNVVLLVSAMPELSFRVKRVKNQFHLTIKKSSGRP